MNWEKGDIAICVNSGDLNTRRGLNPPLRKNKEYVVDYVFNCECGATALDVGLLNNTTTLYIECNCGRKAKFSNQAWMCSSERFVKKEIKSVEQQIADLLKQDNEVKQPIKNEK